MILLPPAPTLFPYTTLFRSVSWRFDVGQRWPTTGVLELLADFLRTAISFGGLRNGRSARLCEEDARRRSEEHTSELQSPCNLVCRLLLEKKKSKMIMYF